MSSQTTITPRQRIPWFVVGDWDGCVALFFSSFPDMLLIAGPVPLCGFPPSMVAARIQPGAALSIPGGNMFYSWQAHRPAEPTRRTDVTTIPFGVNAPTIFASIFLIMLPVHERTHDSNIAWQAGGFACFLSGIVQTAGTICTDWLRRHTPRAALLCPLAFVLDRRFLHAAAWLCAAAVLSSFGLIHALRISSQGVENVIGFLAAPAFAASYLAGAAFLVAFHFYAARPGTVVERGEIL